MTFYVKGIHDNKEKYLDYLFIFKAKYLIEKLIETQDFSGPTDWQGNTFPQAIYCSISMERESNFHVLCKRNTH